MNEKLYYPVLFHREETGYSVTVPDLDGCFSQGDTLEEAVKMVREAIGLWLGSDGAEAVPAASDPGAIRATGGDFVMMVEFDRLAYEKKHGSRPVKKTLSIPAWLNTRAEEANLNFSHVLQDALKVKLNL